MRGDNIMEVMRERNHAQKMAYNEDENQCIEFRTFQNTNSATGIEITLD
jgi:hypothetical protein